MIFTKQFMIENCGCYSIEKLEACSFFGDAITLQSIIESEIPLKDKFWFICNKVNSKEQNHKLSIDVAEIVLPIYEKRYPGDSRVRKSIDAAKQYISGNISLLELREKQNAADYAAAAYAAAAAAAAADYAAAAADDDRYNEILLSYLKVFCNEQFRPDVNKVS